MTQLLVEWLNQEVQLSERITSLEDDMHNGYLLGEVLYRHNQLPTLGKFSRKPTADSHISNFCQLEPVLRGLDIHFDARTAHSIMKREPGVITNVLYKLKMALDRRKTQEVPGPASEMDGSGTIKRLSNMPLRLSKPTYDRASTVLFESNIRMLVENQTDAILADRLKRFDEAGEQWERRYRREMATIGAEALSKAWADESRRQRMSAMQQEKLFKATYEQRGLAIWMDNQDRQKARKTLQRKLHRSAERMAVTARQERRARGAREVEQGIDDFEARLSVTRRKQEADRARPEQPEDGTSRLPVEAATEEEEQEGLSKQDELAMVLERDQRELAMDRHLKTQRANREEQERLTSAREKRRRRFITEREEAQVVEYHQRAAEHLQNQLTRGCLGEKALDLSLAMVKAHGAMMTENRRFRAAQYKTRADVDLEEALARDNAHLDAQRTAYEDALATQHRKYSAALEARAAAQRRRNIELCEDVIHRAVDLALQVVAFRRFTGLAGQSNGGMGSSAAGHVAVGLPEEEWLDMKRVFISGKPLLALDARRPGPALGDAEASWGERSTLALATRPGAHPVEEGDYDATARLLDAEELSDYLGNRHLWFSKGLAHLLAGSSGTLATEKEGEQGKAAEGSDAADGQQAERADAPEQAAATANPDGPVVSVLDVCAPRHALGEAVLEARLLSEPLPPPPPPPKVPEFDLCMCFCGKSFSGKSEQARLVAERFRLKVISTGDLLREALSRARDVQLGKIEVNDGAVGVFGGEEWLSGELARLGQLATGYMFKGQTVPDDLYAELAILGVHRVGIENNQRKQFETVAVDGGENTGNGDSLTVDQWMGWVVEDFPETEHQAVVFEKLLSGFDAHAVAPSRWDRATLLAAPRPRQDVPCEPLSGNEDAGSELVAGLPPFPQRSGIDLCVYLEADRDVVLRRCLGRRIDPVTSEAYHLDNNRPPYDMICKERLVEPADPANPASALGLQLASHDLKSKPLLGLLKRFGTLRVVNTSTLSTQGVFAAVIQHVNSMLEDRVRRSANGSIPGTAGAGAGGAATPALETGAALNGEAEPTQDGGAEGEAGGAAGADAGQQTAPADGQAPSEVVGSAKEPANEIRKHPPGLSKPLADIVAGLWKSSEDHFLLNCQRVFRAMREERAAVRDRLFRLRVRFDDFLHRPDGKQDILDGFLASFNSVDEDMRFDELTKCELHLRCEELRHRLWAETEEREASAIARLEAIRTDGWLEQRVEALERNLVSLVQLELERFNAGLHVLHDFHAAHTGRPPEGVLTRVEVEGLSLGDAEENEDKGGKDKGSKDKGKGKGKGRGGGGADGGSTADEDEVQYLLPVPGLPPDVIARFVAKDPAAQPPDDPKAAKKKDKKGKDAPPEEPEKLLHSVVACAREYVQQFTRQVYTVPPEARTLPLHRAVWFEADAALERVLRIEDHLARVESRLRSEVGEVFAELQASYQARVAQELAACERVTAMARAAVEDERALEYDLSIVDGVQVIVDQLRRLLAPAPIQPPPEVPPRHFSRLNPAQAAGLQSALVEAAEAEGFADPQDPAHASMLSVPSLLDVLLRLSVSDSGLTEFWSAPDCEEQFGKLVSAVDKLDKGFVSVGEVAQVFATPEKFGWSIDELKVDSAEDEEGEAQAPAGLAPQPTLPQQTEVQQEQKGEPSTAANRDQGAPK